MDREPTSPAATRSLDGMDGMANADPLDGAPSAAGSAPATRAAGAGDAAAAAEAAGAADAAAELVRRIGAGEARAEEDLVLLYSRGLLFFLRRLSGDPALSDDLHQETFRVVLERLRREGLEDPAKLSAFILRTARYLFLGVYRKQKRRDDRYLGDDEDPPDPAPGQLSRVLQEEEAAAVQRLIAELGTGRDRQILARFYLAEEDKETICADLGLSALHFNRVLFRARQRFKQLLERRREGG